MAPGGAPDRATHPPHTTTVWAWENTVVLRARAAGGGEAGGCRGPTRARHGARRAAPRAGAAHAHLGAARALDVHEVRVRALYQALELVLVGLLGRARVKQVADGGLRAPRREWIRERAAATGCGQLGPHAPPLRTMGSGAAVLSA